MKKSFPKRGKNRDLLVDFGQYCANHPEERFWQALRNWSGADMIVYQDRLCGMEDSRDTFYFEGKDK